MVETKGGVLVRNVQSASPLHDDLTHGDAAEVATRNAATVWGMPDFFYRPARVAVGAGSREIGDGTLIVGDRGVVIQVKAREGEPGDDVREHNWLTKQVANGLRQAHGTIRNLRRTAVQMTNGRGRTFTVDGRAIQWFAVVVVDHPWVPDDYTPSVEGQPNPSLVLLRRDWEFLFEQLKSTFAVVQYIERVAGEPSELGAETLRYYQLAQADEAAKPGDIDPRILGTGGRHFSAPLLPMLPAATGDDTRAHMLVRLLFEDVAVSAGENLTEENRLRVLAALDTLTVAVRSEVGNFLLEAMDAMAEVPSGTTAWQQRRVLNDDDFAQLAFGACSEPHSEEILDLFQWWVMLRHHDLYQRVEDPDALITVGILLTPRTDGVRDWDTTALAVSPGDLRLTPEELAAFRQVWPETDAQTP